MRSFWQQRIVKPLFDLLASGLTAEQIALSITLGVVLGVFPILGCPTIFCLLAAFTLRLNLPALQFVNYLVYPLQLGLLIPFIRMGAWLFRSTPASSPLFDLLIATAHTVAAWFCVCAPAGLLLYTVLAAVLRRSDGEDRAARWIIKTGKIRKAECPINTPTCLTRQVQPAPLI